MRIALPFLVPLACLLGILVVPDQAVAFSAALLSSIITLGLASPALFSASESTSADEARSSQATSPAPQTASAEISAPTSKPVTSWRRPLWLSGIALEVAAIAWTFVSLGGLVIAPENAHTWSLHLGGSMLMVMFWTPLVVFMRPSDTDAADSAAADAHAADMNAVDDAAPDFVAEEEKTLRPSVAEQKQEARGDASFWSMSEARGDSVSANDTSVDVAPRETNDDVQARRAPAPDSGAEWAAWPDEDDDMEARRALWSFPDEEEATTNNQVSEPSPGASAPREMRAAQKAAAAEWDTADHDDEMAWDILESILEEDESKTSDSGSSWEPDEWPDFNYDV